MTTVRCDHECSKNQDGICQAEELEIIGEGFPSGVICVICPEDAVWGDEEA